MLYVNKNLNKSLTNFFLRNLTCINIHIGFKFIVLFRYFNDTWVALYSNVISFAVFQLRNPKKIILDILEESQTPNLNLKEKLFPLFR